MWRKRFVYVTFSFSSSFISLQTIMIIIFRLLKIIKSKFSLKIVFQLLERQILLN